MKKSLILSIIILSCIYCANVNGQSQKTGYLSVERVMSVMPELPGVRSEMQDFQSKINSQIQVKYEVLQSKIADYESLVLGLDQEGKLSKEKEIQSLDRDLQQYRQQAQEASTEKENKLLAPIYKRIQEAIDLVAEAEGLDQVLRADTILYIADGADIFDLVIKQLGIELPKEAG